MNRVALIAIGAALLLALVIAVSLQFMHKKPAKVAAPAGTEILVAARDLPAGEPLKAENVRWQLFPDDLVFGGVIKKKDQGDINKLDVYGQPLRRDLQFGEPVTMQSLVDSKGNGNYLAASLEPGMRAVAISVKAESSAGGFVAPGDHVDVILNFQVSLRGEAADFSESTVQKYASETILSNVKVLAVDQNAKEASKEAKVGRTITLEVSKQGAQVLAMATNMGDITLALRRLGEKDSPDDATPLTTDVSTSKIIQKIYKDEMTGSSKASNETVRMYNGSEVINLPVRAPKK